MAETGSYNLGFRFDIKQILLEAKHRWLRPAEISEILRNYEKFQISSEAPNKPISGSVFLFDRKVLRYFRKDGHNWRKKKDGKTVKEAHEKLKVGSVDMLHCYYAHGEDNENFQRRSYWLLEPELMHIVFVHYFEAKGNKTNLSGVRNSDRIASNSENGSPMSSSFCGASHASNLSPAYDDAESEGNHQASSRFDLYPESALADDGHSAAQSSSYNELFNPVNQNAPALNYASVSRSHTDEDYGGGILLTGAQATVDLASSVGYPGIIAGENVYRPEYIGSVPAHSHWQVLNNSFEDKPAPPGQGDSQQKEQLGQRSFQSLFPNVEPGNAMDQNLENSMTAIENENHSFLLKKPLISGLQTDESLKKVDSFSRWFAKEFGDADELNVQSSNGISWSAMASEDESTIISQLQVEHTFNPSISQDQLFSIVEFSPNWAYANLETKVLVTGIFLKGEEEIYRCRWSIMFGEVEVLADVLGNGILCCSAPLHNPGLVPFYVTCSNRSACSEIRDFEYKSEQNIRSLDSYQDRGSVMHLCQRFDKILDLEPTGSPVHSARSDFEKQSMINKIISLIDEDGDQGMRLTSESDMSQLVVIGELLLVKQLKEKFFSWLVHRVGEDGKELMIIDAGGQGVLHLAAALGFNWALQPMITAGVSIDFRDVNGWSALHWAAFCGREETVVALVSLGAAPGPLLDPKSEYPLGRTPADLASSSGHKGISGYLAEAYLTNQLTTLTVKDNVITEASGSEAIQTLSERSAVATTEEDVPETLSLKDSLAAICNATQAAARIEQIFRIQSFRRRQHTEGGSDNVLTPEEQVVSLAVKSSRLGHSDGMADAALRIQKKYRGWKTRREFLQIRQKIVKIQAHVRGHQVRKKYKPIIWSVGILEKVILRWRRKRSGLRGFRSDLVQKGPSTQDTMPTQEDDYDFLKEGRKQTEERMHKALDRVKSMVQYPEARAQYRRLLNAAQEIRETKDASDMISDNMEDMNYPEADLLDVSSLLDDDTFMSLAFQ